MLNFCPVQVGLLVTIIIILSRDVEAVMRLSKMMCLGLVMAMFMAFSLGGCSDKTPESAGEGAAISDTEALGATESLETEVSENDNIMEGRTSGPMLPVYFDFDSAMIQSDQVQRIEENAEYLKENGTVKVRIEGNCDPRGTREYNLALGERRALNAKKYLVNLGVGAERLFTVSWGEEKLLLYGHDELSWAQNRRDDFVIVK
jgi:peptidoglycan-associated lipoprotein